MRLGLPSGGASGNAGITRGPVLGQNSCLTGPSGQLAWAVSTGTPSHAALSMNTADPSTLSAEWANPAGTPEGFTNYSPTASSGGWWDGHVDGRGADVRVVPPHSS